MGVDVGACDLALRAAMEIIDESCGKIDGSMIRERNSKEIIMKTVRLKESVYNRLEVLMVGKDTFGIVLVRLLDCYEQIPAVMKQIRIAKTVDAGNFAFMEDSGVYQNEPTKTIRIALAVHERLGWLGTSKDTISDVLGKILDSPCEKKLQEDIMARWVKSKPKFST
jgi:predicted CopG family antitoxin